SSLWVRVKGTGWVYRKVGSEPAGKPRAPETVKSGVERAEAGVEERPVEAGGKPRVQAEPERAEARVEAAKPGTEPGVEAAEPGGEPAREPGAKARVGPALKPTRGVPGVDLAWGRCHPKEGKDRSAGGQELSEHGQSPLFVGVEVGTHFLRACGR